MRFTKYLLFIWLAFVMLAFVGGCGSGSDSTNTSGTLVLSSVTQSGSQIVAKVQYTPADAKKDPRNMEVQISSSPAVFGSQTAILDQSGQGVAILSPTASTLPSSVTITAKVGGLVDVKSVDIKTSDVTTTVPTTDQPGSLTISAPANTEKTVKAAGGGTVTFVPSGVEKFTVLKSGSSSVPLANVPVTLSVQTVLNSTNYVVTFWQNYPSVPSPTGTSITVTTDSIGQFPNQTTVDVAFPATAVGTTSNAVITVIWKVTYTSTAGTSVGYASTQYQVTNSP
jgi:hypothetical protein